MSDQQAIARIPEPGSYRKPTADTSRVTAKVRTAIEAMVWNGRPRAQAAAEAGLAEHSLYKALRRPPVKALYLNELQVLRDSERARSVHALIAVRDQTDNQKARVDAVRALHGDDFGSDTTRSAAEHTKGVVIQIVTQALPAVDITPDDTSNASDLADDGT